VTGFKATMAQFVANRCHTPALAPESAPRLSIMHTTAMNRLRESGAVNTSNCLVELARVGPTTPTRFRA
jgi:hypothetical protein